MIEMEVNNRKVSAEPGETVLTALERAGIKVPTLCHLATLSPTGACRMCVVEVEGQRNLVPACAFPAAEGLKITTHSPRAVRARKTIIELLLANHPDDCLYCMRSGECDLQDLAREHGVRDRRFCGGRNVHRLDVSSPAILRDPDKCILCGKCVRVCEEIQGVGAIDFLGRGSQAIVGTAFNQGLNISSCINCGQCVTVCPTGALREQSHLKEVSAALHDSDMMVVVQHAPSISVTIAEEFGARPGHDASGTLNAALRRLGFDRVFDSAFAADLTIMEEASELVQRIQTGGRLPMMTSCSPGWVKFVEQQYPDFRENLSTCKSPQQMLGAVIKTYFADKAGVPPEKIFSVAVMPCAAKKFEAQRPEMGRDGLADVDAVLTTRELVRMIRNLGMDLRALDPEPADDVLGERSSAGKMFGVTGGVMEAALRTAHHLLTGTELPALRLKPLRGLRGVKHARVTINGLELGVAVVSGLGNAIKLLEELRAGRDDLHFIEVMTCPGGCIAGGGQPFKTDIAAVRARMRALYTIDRDEPVRMSHHNEALQRLYREFLGAPLGERSHALLHTHYVQREVVR
ncbi:MAG TPA: NADH-dependent [FeFe] hydrogenase, group A6 [Phycisphaerae bacterium]|nr:iron hydrogenase small subunit [Phycisphaerales bacterium]HRX87512.1 NADH-dependent [FeFe] hydrogenase, group A6 [Phycisphaerae bacterium]